MASPRKGTSAKRDRARKAAPAAAADRSTTAEDGRPDPCLIVALGASAGGLEALRRFFHAMPPDSGMAFVVIQHLDPTHESLAAELLAGHTTMSVVQVNETTTAIANHVYVNPPSKHLSIDGGGLHLNEIEARRTLRMPIDFFLRTLARDQGKRAAAVILSGTGTDGTLGLKEVKAAGGLAIAQDPATAQYDGMPRSAIAADGVDHVVRIEEMPEVLLRYVRHSYLKDSLVEHPSEEGEPGDLNNVVALVRARTKFDFAPYKKGTLGRRVYRRMALRHVERVDDYLQLLRSNPAEVSALQSDMLIGVSSFFRDRAAWEVLERDVVRKVVAQKPAGGSIRAWVPGCAAGEEAYSVAMLLIEQLQAAHKSCDVQVFASDVDARALEQARTGVYPESIAADVSPERLRRFFTSSGGVYRVSKELRESVIFANQNLITDPPFSRLDLISCRNLLIYLEADVQTRIVGLFHFALAEGGYLFLGSAESIGQADDLFQPVSRKWRIYRRIGPARNDRVYFPVERGGETTAAPPVAPRPAAAEARLDATVQQILLERYAPASVVVNRRCEIVYFNGPTQAYLLQPSGIPTYDLIAQAREGLQTKLRAAVHRALRDDQRVTVAGINIHRDDKPCRVRITVEPLKASKETEGLLLVSFEDEPGEPIAVPAETPPTAGGDEWLVRQLEHELKTTREDLQSTIEELETSNEELKASNEEAMSVNEELQSTNEELETSKEEMQSLNEELSTVNAQLQSKVEELERTSNDLDNLLTSTGVPTIFLDRQLRIRRFTPSATTLFSLIPSDVGRPLRDISPRFVDPELMNHAEAVRDTLVPLTREVRTEEGRFFMRQVLPYRTLDDRIEGVVVTFSDVAAAELQAARAYAESIVDTVREGLVVLDSDLRVVSANRSFFEMFQVTRSETEGRSIFELGNRQWDIPRLRTVLSRIGAERQELSHFEVEHDFEKLGRRTMLLNGRFLASDGAPGRFFLLAVEDITERKRDRAELEERTARIRGILDAAADGIITIDERGAILSFNAAAARIFGWREDEVSGKNVRLLMPAPYRDEHDRYLASYLATRQARIIGIGREVVGLRRDGSEFPMDLTVSEYHDGASSRFIGTVRDITARKRAELEIHAREAELVHVQRLATLGQLAAGLTHELAQPLAAVTNEIAACANLIASGAGDATRVSAGLRRAGEQAERVRQILQHLRHLVEKRPARMERRDLRDIVNDGVGLMQRAIDGQRIHLRLDSEAQPLLVEADRIQIEQVLVNLLQNALDAIGAAGGPREISVHCRRREDAMAEVAVRDTGAGLSQAEFAKLFEPFYTTKPQGLGMGLAISQTIIEAHGGRLWADPPAPGAGTTIRFALPLLPAGSGGSGRPT